MKKLLILAFACVSALGLLFVGLVAGLPEYLSCSERPESYYPTRKDAEATGLFERSRVLPESAGKVREMHDIDTNYVWARFEFEESDEPAVPQGARRLESEELRGVEVPIAPCGGRQWWNLPDGSLEPVAERPGVAVYETREKEPFPTGKERLGYLVVDRTERVAHYFYGY